MWKECGILTHVNIVSLLTYLLNYCGVAYVHTLTAATATDFHAIRKQKSADQESVNTGFRLRDFFCLRVVEIWYPAQSYSNPL